MGFDDISTRSTAFVPITTAAVEQMTSVCQPPDDDKTKREFYLLHYTRSAITQQPIDATIKNIYIFFIKEDRSMNARRKHQQDF